MDKMKTVILLFQCVSLWSVPWQSLNIVLYAMMFLQQTSDQK